MAAIVALLLLLGVYYFNYLGATWDILWGSIANLGEVFPFPYMPAGLFFSLAWGLIFVMLGVTMILILIRFFSGKKYHKKITWLFALTSLLNIAWVIVTSREIYVLSVIIIALIMLVLMFILDKYRKNLMQHTFGRRAFGAYYGWISMATTVLSVSILIYLFNPAFALSSLRAYCALAIGVIVTYFSWRARRNPMALLLSFRALIWALTAFLS